MKTKLTAFLALLLITFSANAQIDRSTMPVAGPEPEISIEKPQEFQLKNGLKVLVVENHKLPRVSYSLRIDNKPIATADKAGVESLIGSMLGNGTTEISKDEFNEEIDFLGASLNFGFSGGFASSLSKYSDRILELMAGAAINPLLTKEEFEKEKTILLENIKSNEKNPDVIAGRVGSALSYGTKHPYGEFTTKETVENVTYGDAVSFYEKYFNPDNAYLVVIGDVDFKTVKKQIEKHFGDWTKSVGVNTSVPEPNENVQYTQINFVDVPDATQSNLSITNNVDLKMNDKDYHAALITNNILGGGGEGYLFKNLREDKGYTYGAYSSLGTDRYGASRFNASAKVRNAVTDSAVVEALKEINRIKTEPVDPQTLSDAKAKYIGNFVMALERPETIANYALNIKINDLPEDFYSTYLQKIKDVSVEDVQRVANKHLKTDNARIVVVGNGDEVLENLEKTGIPIKYYDKYAAPTEKPNYEIEMSADIDVAKVLNAYIEKIGGKEKLSNVTSVNIMAEAELQPGMMMNLEMKKTNKNQFSQEVTAMGQSVMKTVIDGESGYVVMQGQKSDMSEDDLKKSSAETSPFPEVNYLNGGATLEKIEDVDGEKAYKVNVGNDTSIYYSVDTGLKIKEVKTTPMGSQSTFYTDYKEVAGIMFPFKISQTVGPRKFDFMVKEVKVNEGVTDADFD
ncbi:M16 family metallopeptidase [Winogradskyella ursingii]|uniref:M16 family metallopeptidase n=1 Tax=Winogradskyella ursingii TaxID=2686079 RepID=UPI0015C73614|nr:pitrilysin family protein [Winogradskyella ursingii]